MPPHTNPNNNNNNSGISNNTSNTSTPPRTSFASALAQKPALASSKPGSPSKTAASSNSNAAPSDQSPIVKLPVSGSDKNAGNGGSNGSNGASSSSASSNQLGNNVKVTPIKFGSFAAAAAAAANPSSEANNNSSTAASANNNNGPILPPRTQSAPPSMIEQKKQQQQPQVPNTNAVNGVDMEAAVILPSIQEDSQQHQSPSVMATAVNDQQQQQSQLQNGLYANSAMNNGAPLPYDPNFQYQPRPHRYFNNPNGPHQRQQHYNNYGGYNPNYYVPQQQQQQNYYHHNPNYRGNYQNYRPRYQNQGGHHQHHYAPQGDFYHPNGSIPMAAAQPYYPGYYAARPAPPSSSQANEGVNPATVAPSANSGAATAGVPFQRPAPALNNFVAQPVAPVVPSDLSTFAAASESVKQPASSPAEPSSTNATAAVVPPVKLAPSKIKIVDPNTGKELNFGGSAAKKEEPTVKATVEPVVEATAAVASKPVVVPAKPVEPVKPVAPVVKAVETVKPPTSTTPAVAKKISIVIKDPNSNKELDLNQVVARPVISVKEDLAVEELTAAFTQGTKLEDDDFDGASVSAASISVSASPAPFEHDKNILANLNVDDDELSDDDEDDLSDEDYSDYSDVEDEEEVFIPSTVQYNQSISYPEGFLPFKAPSEEGVWLYSREFMMQFREKCKTTPGDLQERLSAAVEKAKAFASSERINGSDRHHGGRRDHSHHHERKKRRNHGGPLGPQAHLLDMNAVLKNRAENAWAPVRSAEELSQVERILREVKGLLNKLTLEKFHVISDRILALGIMSSDVLSGVIDCIFDKSVSEPRFAPMYAELCYKIVVEELNGLKKSLPANVAPDSQFRRLLVDRCQAEYKHKRAWSKKRLEKLLETGEGNADNAETAATTTDATAADDSTAAATSNVGELTDEDYLLIKLKRRVLGNMRFIGEIFKVGLIGEKIMHSIITELLSNVENPEEEEIECLCRLLMTVGAILDKPEAANFWSQYLGRMNWLVSRPDKLSSRVRFLVMDTVELREKKWKTGRAEDGPKTIAQIQKEQQAKERNEREKDREYRDRERGDRDHRDRRDRRNDGNGPNNNNNPNAPATIKFTTKAGKQSSGGEEWNRSGSGKGGSLSRGPSMRRPNTPSGNTNTNNNSNSVPSSTSNNANAGGSISTSAGNFGVLSTVEAEQSATSANAAKAASTATSDICDSERIKKIVSLLDELVQMNNYPDVYEEIVACADRSAALSGLLSKAIEASKAPALQAVIRIFIECPEIARETQLAACKRSLGSIDDLAVDVPSVYDMAGKLYAALQLSVPEILETVADCPDESAKTRLILYACHHTESVDKKESILGEAKEFLAPHAKKLPIENLAKRLGIQIA